VTVVHDVITSDVSSDARGVTVCARVVAGTDAVVRSVSDSDTRGTMLTRTSPCTAAAAAAGDGCSRGH